MGYTKDTIKGLSWISLLRIATRILTFIRLAILGRLLTPTQFGYFGIATLLLAFLEIITETGINVFLVQEKKQIKEYVNSAWIISLARGVILSFIILISAPFLVTFFNAPEALSVIMLMAGVPLIRGFINPAIVSYQKDLLFNKEFRLRFILFLVDAIVVILLAFFTRDATSFVWGLIASAVLEVILSYVLIPLWPKLIFQFNQIKYIIKRGSWVTLTGIFSYLADNGDSITVGKLLGTGSLGIYQMAYKFSMLPVSEITNVVNQVVFPVYTKFSEDKERLWNAFLKVTSATFLGAIILGGAIYLLAEPLVLFVLGKQWVAAIPIIQVLAVFGMLRTMFGSFSALFLSVRKQEYVAQMLFCRLLGLAITIIPFITWFGMVGAGYAMIVSVFVEIPFILYFTYMIFRSPQKTF